MSCNSMEIRPQGSSSYYDIATTYPGGTVLSGPNYINNATVDVKAQGSITFVYSDFLQYWVQIANT